MKKIFLAALLLCAVTTAYSQKKKGEDHTINLQKANKEYVLEDSRYYTWGASPIKGKDGKYHLYYSRWDKRYGFLA